MKEEKGTSKGEYLAMGAAKVAIIWAMRRNARHRTGIGYPRSRDSARRARGI